MTLNDTQFHEVLLDVLTQCQADFVSGTKPQIIFSRLLHFVLMHTQSTFGFVGEILSEQDSTRLMLYAHGSLQGDEWLESPFSNAADGHATLNVENRFGHWLMRGTPLMANEGDQDLRLHDMDLPRPKLTSFCAIPLFMNDKWVGVIGMGNSSHGYDSILVDQLTSFWRMTTHFMVQAANRRERKATVNELMVSQKKLAAVFDAIVDAILVIDFRGRITDLNSAACRMFGYTREEVIGRNVAILMPSHYASRHDQFLRQYYTSDEPKLIGKSREFEAKRADGTLFPITLGVTEIQDQNTRCFVGSIKDISAQKRQEEKLRSITLALENERWRLRSIIDGTYIGTWEWNVQTGETRFNARWAEMIGYQLEELEPISIRSVQRFIHPDDLQCIYSALDRHFKGEMEFYDVEYRMAHSDGHWVWVSVKGKVFSWDAGKPLMMYGSQQDITERKEFEAKLKYMAMHDALTGLPTLTLANDRIASAVAQARRDSTRAAVLFVDLDGFKSVNDTAGHGAGDAVLKEISSRLLSSVRKVDTVARMGGDEFLVILPHIDSCANAKLFATKLIKQVCGPINYDHHVFQLGFSVGIAMIPDDGDQPKILIDAADVAMYAVKSSGKNGVRAYSEISHHALSID